MSHRPAGPPPLSSTVLAVIQRHAKARIVVERVRWPEFNGRPAYTAISLTVENVTLAGNWMKSRQRCSLRGGNELLQISNLLKAEGAAESQSPNGAQHAEHPSD